MREGQGGKGEEEARLVRSGSPFGRGNTASRDHLLVSLSVARVLKIFDQTPVLSFSRCSRCAFIEVFLLCLERSSCNSLCVCQRYRVNSDYNATMMDEHKASDDTVSFHRETLRQVSTVFTHAFRIT